MAPSTTWHSATLTHISKSQNYTLPTALRKKVWDWALSSPPSVHLGRLLPERAHPFPCRRTLSASCRGTLSSATHTLPRPFLSTQLRSPEGTGGSTWLWQIQGCCLREASCCRSGKAPATCNGASSHGGGAATALRARPLGRAQGPVGASPRNGVAAPRPPFAVRQIQRERGQVRGAAGGGSSGMELWIRALSPAVPRAAAAAVEGVPSQGNYNGGLSQHQKSCYWAA